MTVSVTSLTDLTQAEVDQQKELNKTIVQEYNAEVDLKRGVVHDLVLQPSAVLSAVNNRNIELVQDSSSVQAVVDDPAGADTDVVDRLASNYLISRKAGTYATGNLTLVFSALQPVVIPAGTVFTINDLDYTTDEAYMGRTSSGLVLTDNDRLLTAMEAGRWGFNVAVTASAVGTASNAKRAATATTEAVIPAFVKAYAAADFTGGVDDETNAALIARVEAGVGVRAWSNRVTIESMIRAQEDFADIISLSIIGFGDAEMLRDQHSIWPGSLGGRVDLYLISQLGWKTTTLAKTATLLSKVGAVGTWQFSVTRDEAPGYYEIEKIQLTTSDATAAGYSVLTETRSYSLTEDDDHEFIPDITSATEAVYTNFQTSTVTFTDTVTDATSLTTGVSTKSYNVVVRHMPLVLELQAYLTQRSVRPTMSDICVKAAVPCFLSISLTANIKAGITAPSTASMQQAVSDAINGLGFAGSLSASFLSNLMHTLIPTGLVSVTSIDMLGRVRKPSGSESIVRSSTLLTIPDAPADMTTGRTVALLCQPSDVAITVTTVDTPNL